ncbi:NAD(P)/FAD-dependent oxidoreductase [candidate division KSB1 bacterium]
MESKHPKNLELVDGSNIGIIGGGPAGSFFTYFALEFAERYGLEINIDVIEAKDFNCAGPTGCNNCGGIVSESLVQMLATEGIVLPSNVIRRGIESYTLHLEQGTTAIEAPFNEQKIAAMFRGKGPKGSVETGLESFDNFLLELCRKKGANVYFDKVTEVIKESDGVTIKTKKSFEKKYDLVVGAIGLNKRTLELFDSVVPDFRPPGITKTFITEIYLEEEIIDKYFGNSMHVFLLNLPNIKFGAIIPKGQYVTLVLLGVDVNKDIVAGFLDSKAVRDCFPPETDLKGIMHCQCYPPINVIGSLPAFTDRVVLVGDCSSSKLFKNGIGAAYTTGKSAAKTVIFNGISKRDFQKNYRPICRELNRDNKMGKFIFAVTTIIQKSSSIKRGMLSLVIKEQYKVRHRRYLSAVLWDTFTGSAPYRDIFRRFLNPILLTALIWHILKENLKELTKRK